MPRTVVLLKYSAHRDCLIIPAPLAKPLLTIVSKRMTLSLSFSLSFFLSLSLSPTQSLSLSSDTFYRCPTHTIGYELTNQAYQDWFGANLDYPALCKQETLYTCLLNSLMLQHQLCGNKEYVSNQGWRQLLGNILLILLVVVFIKDIQFEQEDIRWFCGDRINIIYNVVTDYGTLNNVV